jgi:O-antigen/teichoic acid export membrane protein
MGVGLYTSRLVLQELGVVDYGIYGIVGGIVAMFGFFNAAMSSATQRYLTFDIGKNDKTRLSKTFSAALTIHIAIAFLVLFLAETIGLWYINNIMVFPQERTFAVNVVYQFSIAAALLGIIQVPYNALIIAHERMNVYAYVSILEVILKLIIVILLVYFGSDKLITYSVLAFVVAFIIRMTYQDYCRKNFEESKYKFEYDKVYYKELVRFTGWSLFGNIAAVARGQGNNILLNLFFGPIANAAFAITLIVQGIVGSFVGNFQVAVNPQIIKNYSQGNLVEMQKLISRSSKFSFFLLLILVLPVLLNVDYLLKIWLNTVPDYTGIFVKLSLIYIMIDSISYSLITAVQASGKIKWYQIILGTFIFLNFPISYFVLKLGGAAESVFYILIIITFLTLVFRMFFVKKLLRLPPIFFIKNTIFPILIVCSAILLSYWLLIEYLNFNFIATTIFGLVSISFICTSIAILIIIFLGMKMNERKFILLMIIKKWKTLKKS